MQVPVNIYAEMTPNPSTMKFVANKYILVNNESVEFTNGNDAKGYSPLALELFNFPFVKGVYMSSNFVTITKDESIPWDYITMELREFIREWISEGKEILTKIPDAKPLPVQDENTPMKEYLPSEYDDAIRSLLDEHIRGAVEQDGGAIDFRSFENGVVTVLLKGSCAGCPSSTITLKNGIENILKQHLPAVKEVVAENA